MTAYGIISMVCILGFYAICLAGVIYKIFTAKNM